MRAEVGELKTYILTHAKTVISAVYTTESVCRPCLHPFETTTFVGRHTGTTILINDPEINIRVRTHTVIQGTHIHIHA